MTVCVYVGPTVAVRDIRDVLDATCLPPVKHGDIYRAVKILAPRAIGIIDGYFQAVPSVWHKEILWAMGEGVHVFGAASMGALRAAELCSFGMHGVGRIFEAYRDGVLDGCGDDPFEDDDEVAVVHAPAEAGYLAMSDAMVNVRCTLAKAVSEGVIDAGACATLVRIGKSVFFPDRTYERLLAEAGAALPAETLARLRAWLPGGRVDQKREDALALARRLAQVTARTLDPAKPRFTFEQTTLWRRAMENLDRLPSVHDSGTQAVLDELRVDVRRFDAMRESALDELVGPAAASTLPHPSQTAARAAQAHKRPAEIDSLYAETARMHAAQRLRVELPRAIVEARMAAQVRESGDFQSLEQRSARKAALLTAGGVPSIEDFSDIQLLELADWYFVSVLDSEIPDDLEAWILERGYGDLHAFQRAIFAEFICREAQDEPSTPARTTGRA